MNCPNCGYRRAKYKVSRKVLWGGHRIESSLTRKLDVRKDFNATCPKCGYEWNNIPEVMLWNNIPEDYVALTTPTETEDQDELEETEMDVGDEEE